MRKYLLVCTNDFDEVLDTFVVHTSSIRKAFEDVVSKNGLNLTSYLNWTLITLRSHRLVGSCGSSGMFCSNLNRYYSSVFRFDFDYRRMPDDTVRCFLKEVVE
nr:MAG TPA: hypothetical protein [Microviridae sp.]